MDNPWAMVGAFLAGWFSAISTGGMVGLIVYKTKFQGAPIFKREKDTEAEVFNLDEEFTDDDEIKPTEFPKEVEESIDAFESQFGMERMMKEAEKYKLPEEETVDAT